MPASTVRRNLVIIAAVDKEVQHASKKRGVTVTAMYRQLVSVGLLAVKDGSKLVVRDAQGEREVLLT